MRPCAYVSIVRGRRVRQNLPGRRMGSVLVRDKGVHPLDAVPHIVISDGIRSLLEDVLVGGAPCSTNPENRHRGAWFMQPRR